MLRLAIPTRRLLGFLMLLALAVSAQAQRPIAPVPSGNGFERQQPVEDSDGGEDGESGKAGEAGKDDDQAEQAIEGYTDSELNALVARLGAREFAVRERATDQLVEIGTAIIPRLRKVRESADDPEIRLRAAEIVRQLTSGSLEAQIESFLAGEPVNFDGWPTIRGLFGDTQGAREVFVELMSQHPTLTKSLEGETRDRALAVESVLAVVQNAMTVERRFPNRADVFALLLASVDPNVPDNATLESQVMMVLNQTSVREIRKDWQLNGPFETLIAIWMSRCSLANRQEILETGMRMGLKPTLELGLRTTREANSVQVIVTALQAIARFGEESDSVGLRRLMKDRRPVKAEGVFGEDPDLTRELGDVAMLTVVILHKRPLKDFGFPLARTHRAVGFELDNVGFTSEEAREEARESIDDLFPDTLPLIAR